jgi:feruloyl esterase
MKSFLSLPTALALLLAACGGSDPAPVACADLAGLTLPNATVVSATSVPAGTFSPAAGVSLTAMPAFCRVVGNAKPSADSSIGFEVWIPDGGQWNAKYLQVGTQGYAGTYQYGPMAVALKRGYAIASTDTGHPQTVPDLASWAIGHPEKVIDFGYRAHKVTSDLAKAIVKANTASAPTFSYFYGGSNGGREAMMAAQRYPNDFNGYISEGPAVDWTRLSAAWVNTEQALFGDPSSTITGAKLAAIQTAALAACDAADGIADGFVNDPRACNFNADVLLCAGAESDACLTAPQITALKRILDGPRSPGTGLRVYPGFEPGGVNSSVWTTFMTGPAVPGFLTVSGNALLGNSYFGSMVQGVGAPLDFAFQAINFDTDVAAAATKMIGTETLSAVIDATGTNLSGVKAKGAKIIMSTGWDDAVVPARGIIQYYESVVAGATFANDLTATQNSFRLFLVPGEGHLTGGAGATAYGSIFGQPGTASDAKHDMLSALEAWVEHGVAPDSIVAAAYVNGDPAAGVARTRPLCPYPKLARWSGAGSSDDAANFACVDGPRGAY